jgi:hypothetical protein
MRDHPGHKQASIVAPCAPTFEVRTPAPCAPTFEVRTPEALGDDGCQDGRSHHDCAENPIYAEQGQDDRWERVLVVLPVAGVLHDISVDDR